MKIYTLGILLTFISLSSQVYGQIESVGTSNGLLSSHIHLSWYSKAQEDAKNNSKKIGFYNSIDASFKIFKNISLTGSLTYQERWPLEEFKFNNFSEDNETLLGNTIAQFPTSPQSTLWDAEKYIRFPNFRYLIIEAIPEISFGKKVRISVGTGLFYGILLNKSELVFGQNYFPSLDWIFRPPLDYSGVESYNKQDFGWLSSIRVAHPISKDISPKTKQKSTFGEM